VRVRPPPVSAEPRLSNPQVSLFLVSPDLYHAPMPSPPSIGLWHASMAGIRASTPDSRHRAAQMGRSASKTAEPEAKSEAQAKPWEASLQSETAVDASPLGQPCETTSSLTSRPKAEIDADGIDDLQLDA